MDEGGEQNANATEICKTLETWDVKSREEESYGLEKEKSDILGEEY